MIHDKVLFDYFFKNEYHLLEYSINLMDCVIAYEFQLFTNSGLCEMVTGNQGYILITPNSQIMIFIKWN